MKKDNHCSTQKEGMQVFYSTVKERKKEWVETVNKLKECGSLMV